MPGILIVEDEKELKEILKISLLKHRFTVLEAENGKEAIAHFKPSVTDLVITDLIMPEEDGLKVIMELRQIKPSIKIIAISGGGKIGPGNYLNMAKALGADAIFSKPFPINEIISKIEELLIIEQQS
jgi:two-component system, cell cycle response regulator CpdR